MSILVTRHPRPPVAPAHPAFPSTQKVFQSGTTRRPRNQSSNRTSRIRSFITPLLLILLALAASAAPTFAQNTGQWVILAAGESSQNTVDSHPLQFITDWTTTVVGLNTTYSPALTKTWSNSNCSVTGQPAAMTMTAGLLGPIITITLDSSQIVTFASVLTTTTTITGTFTTSGGGCTNADSGTFSATRFGALSGTYTGSIESYALNNPVNVTITLSTDANWNVTGTIVASNKTCFASLTIATTAANAIDPSFASGDVVEVVASDSSGDIAGFVLSATDVNGNYLSPAWPSQFFTTYMVLAGPCAGSGGTDAPFQRVEAPPPPHFRTPVHRSYAQGGTLIFDLGPQPPSHHEPVHHNSEPLEENREDHDTPERR
jgi:hypothetical protein